MSTPPSTEPILAMFTDGGLSLTEQYVRSGADFICSYPAPRWPEDRASCSFICIVSAEHASKVRGSTDGNDTVLLEDTSADAVGPFRTDEVVGRGNLMLSPTDGRLLLVAGGHTVPVLAAAMDEEETHGSRVRQMYLAHHFTTTIGLIHEHHPRLATAATRAEYQRLLDFSSTTRATVAAMVGERATAWARRANIERMPTEALSLLTVPKAAGKRGRPIAERATTSRLREERVGTQMMTARLSMRHSGAKPLTGKTSNMKVAPLAIQPTLWASKVEEGNYFGSLTSEIVQHFSGFRLRAWIAWLCVIAQADTGVPTSASGSREALSKVRALLTQGRSNLSEAEGKHVHNVLAAMEGGFLHVEHERAEDELVPLLVVTSHKATKEDGELVPGEATRVALNPLLHDAYRKGRGVRLATLLLGMGDDTLLTIAASAAAHASLDRTTSPSTVTLPKYLDRFGLLEWAEHLAELRGGPHVVRELQRRVESLRAWSDGQGGTLDLVGGFSLEVHEHDWRKSRVRWGQAPLVLTVERPALPALPAPATDSTHEPVSEPAPVS